MTEVFYTTILSLPDNITEQICQLLIDSTNSLTSGVEHYAYERSVSLFGSTKSVRNLQMSCVHFFHVIEQCLLKVSIAIGTSSLCKRDDSYCMYLLLRGVTWKIDKFHFFIDAGFQDSGAINFIGRIRPIIDSQIRLLYFKFFFFRHFGAFYPPEYQNRLFAHVADCCNASTEIIVHTPGLSQADSNKIRVPKIDTLAYLFYDSESIQFIQSMKISRLALRFHYLWSLPLENAMRNVTCLSIEVDAFKRTRAADRFFIHLFPAVKFLSIRGSLRSCGDLQLPECCHTVDTNYSNLEYLALCDHIKYLCLYGCSRLASCYFERNLMESLQFSLHGLNFNLAGRDEEDHGKLEVELNRLLEYQTNLKLLSVSYKGSLLHMKDAETCKLNVIKFIKEMNRDIDLFIFGDHLAVININLNSATISYIDKLDSENRWMFRRRKKRTVVSLDPANASLILALN